MKVLITGATSGIGASLATLLVEKEWEVVGVGRHFEKLSLTSPYFLPISLDLSDTKNLPEALKTIRKQHSYFDAILLNAGVGLFGHLEEISYSQIEHLLQINLLSHIYCTKNWLPSMKKKKKGHLLFMGSEAALAGKKQGSIYSATKFALRGFTQSLREECRSKNIRVTLINPGFVDTPFFDPLHFHPAPGIGTAIPPKQLALTIFNLLENSELLSFDEINLSPPHQHHIFRFPKNC